MEKTEQHHKRTTNGTELRQYHANARYAVHLTFKVIEDATANENDLNQQQDDKTNDHNLIPF